MPARLTKLQRLEDAVDKLDEMVGSETEDEGLSVAHHDERVKADRHLVNGELYGKLHTHSYNR